MKGIDTIKYLQKGGGTVYSFRVLLLNNKKQKTAYHQNAIQQKNPPKGFYLQHLFPPKINDIKMKGK